MAKISFDFDDTLTKAAWDMEKAVLLGYGPHHENIELLRQFSQEGHEIVIVTARSPSQKSKAAVQEFIKEHGLPIKEVHFTSHTPKGPLLKAIRVDFHFDDRDDQVASAEAHGVRGIKVPHVFDDGAFERKARRAALRLI